MVAQYGVETADTHIGIKPIPVEHQQFMAANPVVNMLAGYFDIPQALARHRFDQFVVVAGQITTCAVCASSMNFCSTFLLWLSGQCSLRFSAPINRLCHRPDTSADNAQFQAN